VLQYNHHGLANPGPTFSKLVKLELGYTTFNSIQTDPKGDVRLRGDDISTRFLPYPSSLEGVAMFHMGHWPRAALAVSHCRVFHRLHYHRWARGAGFRRGVGREGC
jgi:hypothetical protein